MDEKPGGRETTRETSESYSRLTRALRRRLRILENSAQHRRQLVSGQGTHEHPGFHIVLHLPHYQRRIDDQGWLGLDWIYALEKKTALASEHVLGLSKSKTPDEL